MNDDLCQIARAIYDGMDILSKLKEARVRPVPYGYEGQNGHSYTSALIGQMYRNMIDHKFTGALNNDAKFAHMIPTLYKYYETLPHAKKILDKLMKELPDLKLPKLLIEQ